MTDNDASPPSKRHSHLPSCRPAHWSTPGHGPSPPLTASILFPLHQVFLFAMTTTGPACNMLQEVGGLIQAFGDSRASISVVPAPARMARTAVFEDIPGHLCIHVVSRTVVTAFAGNHGLKRHERLHEHNAWQCTACAKAFSRPDALMDIRIRPRPAMVRARWRTWQRLMCRRTVLVPVRPLRMKFTPLPIRITGHR